MTTNHTIHTIQGGYCLVTASQIAQLLSVLSTKQITHYAFRTYCACLEMRESRKAFYQSRPKQAVRGRYAQYKTDEIASLLQANSQRLIPRALKALTKHNLLSFSEKTIQIASEASSEAQELLNECHLGRTPRRKIPVPRRILRFLAGCSQVSVAKTLLFYILRGVSLKRGGIIQAKGTMKSSLLAQLAGMSLRAVRAARRELISLGIITPDETRSQQKLNRTGVFFTIQLGWRPKSARSEDTQKRSHSAPPPLKKRSGSAPPIVRLKTSNEGRNQQLCSRTASGGFSKKKSGAPNLSKVVPKDLEEIPRLKQLYQQAVQRNWVRPSEASWLAWVAAAVRARRQGTQTQGVRLFITLVQRQLYHHISHAEEDEARHMLQQHRDSSTSAVTALVNQVLTTLNPNTIQKSRRGTFTVEQ